MKGTKFCFVDNDGTLRKPDKEITSEEYARLKPSEKWEYDSVTYSKEPTAICDHERLGWPTCSDSENGHCYRKLGVCSSQMKLDGSGEMNDIMKDIIIQGIAAATGETEDAIKKKVDEAWSQ